MGVNGRFEVGLSDQLGDLGQLGATTFHEQETVSRVVLPSLPVHLPPHQRFEAIWNLIKGGV